MGHCTPVSSFLPPSSYIWLPWGHPELFSVIIQLEHQPTNKPTENYAGLTQLQSGPWWGRLRSTQVLFLFNKPFSHDKVHSFHQNTQSSQKAMCLWVGFQWTLSLILQEALRESDLLSLRPVTEGGRRCKNQKYLKREPISQAHNHLYFVQDKHFILQVHISRTTITFPPTWKGDK